MSKKFNTQPTSNGFNVALTKEYVEHRNREERIKERIKIDKENISNVEIFEFIMDTNARLSEIYDMLKELSRSQ